MVNGTIINYTILFAREYLKVIINQILITY